MEELNLVANDFRATTSQRILYFINSLVITSISILIYTQIFQLDLEYFAPGFAVVTLFCSVILTIAFHNVAYSTKIALMAKREDTLTKKGIKDTEGRSKKDVLSEKKQEQKTNTKNEAIAYSILYNNIFFLSSLGVLTFFIFERYEQPL